MDLRKNASTGILVRRYSCFRGRIASSAECKQFRILGVSPPAFAAGLQRLVPGICENSDLVGIKTIRSILHWAC